MLIIGARGFAIEVLEVLYQLDELEQLAFYDDVNSDMPEKLFNRFPVLKNMEKATQYFKKVDNRFAIGIGNSILRKRMYEKFAAIGGVPASIISPKATIGHFNSIIKEGCNIMTGAVITNEVLIEKGCLINLNCTIGHNSIIGDFVEISPGVNISGNCMIGSYSNIGTNATLLPEISIGSNVIVGAGAVVTKNVPDNCLIMGVPAKIIKTLAPLNI
jgi:sugar O-acyltransferase (sialic acid O-acetyltransferase NeuD family)